MSEQQLELNLSYEFKEGDTVRYKFLGTYCLVGKVVGFHMNGTHAFVERESTHKSLDFRITLNSVHLFDMIPEPDAV